MMTPPLSPLSFTYMPDPMVASQQDVSFFCTYDIRGIVSETFDETTFTRLGMAFADWLSMQIGPIGASPLRVVVGRDTRIHSPQLYDAFIAGLNARQVQAVALGLVPTTLVYFSEVATTDAALRSLLSQRGMTLPEAVHASVTITASHNPKNYNGVKFTVGGHSLSAEQIQELRHVFLETPTRLDPMALAQTPDQAPASFDAKAAYLAWILAMFGPPTPERQAIKLVVDSGNGAAGVIAPEVFRAVGFEVISLFEDPDGNFPNHHPDPCVHANLIDLQNAVREHGADLGVAFDGDGDRVGLVDETAAVIPGDRTMMLLAQEILQRLPKSPKPVIVSEVKCSQHLFDVIERLGGQPVMSPTGHAIMKLTMNKVNAVLGGELSGHIFYRHEHWGFDDGLHATLRILMLLLSEKSRHPDTTVSGLLAQFPSSALSEERRVKVAKVHHASVLQRMLSQAQSLSQCAGLPVRSVETLDGIRVNLAGGFWLVRGSNTEPCLTLRCEAPEKATLTQLETWLNHHVDDTITHVVNA